MDKIILVIVVVGAVAFFKGPASQAEIAQNMLNSAGQAIDDGNMLKACLKLQMAKEAFNKVQTNESKDMAARLQPALNKTCNG